jgi:CBS domain-containing protein
MVEARPGELSLFHRRARDLIKRPPVTCGPGVSVVDVARLLSREGVGSVVVVREDGVPVGIVTDRDLRRKVVAEGRDPATTPASAVMSTPLVTLRPSAFAFEAVLEMTRHRIRHVVLVDEGRPVGVVSSRGPFKACGCRICDPIRQHLCPAARGFLRACETCNGSFA